MSEAVNGRRRFGPVVDTRSALGDNCRVRVRWIGDLERLGRLASGIRAERFDELDRYLESQEIRLRSSGLNLVVETTLEDGLRVTVKRFGWRKRWHSWFGAFKRSKATRSFRAARRVLDIGLRTPDPVLAIEFREIGFVQGEEGRRQSGSRRIEGS